ncbi:MAG: MarR family winged helix-turn-helix transcriptional regulator [Coprobacillaceae bacterium]
MCDGIDTENVKKISEEFGCIHKTMHKSMIRAIRAKGIDISPEQTKVLSTISIKKVTNQKELARKIRVTPVTLSVRIQRLEKAGYLSREIDENDKRNYILKVEPKGMELVEESIAIMEDVAKQLFVGFTEEDFQIISGYLKRMRENVRNINKEDM